jgi:hypothetical protein
MTPRIPPSVVEHSLGALSRDEALTWLFRLTGQPNCHFLDDSGVRGAAPP